MIEISFAYTTPAVQAKIKRVTRRDWTDGYARMVQRQIGHTVLALTKQRRFGGTEICPIILESVRREPMSEMPDEDFKLEGFEYLAGMTGGIRLLVKNLWPDYPGPQPIPPQIQKQVAWDCFNHWRLSGGVRWTVRFRY